MATQTAENNRTLIKIFILFSVFKVVTTIKNSKNHSRYFLRRVTKDTLRSSAKTTERHKTIKKNKSKEFNSVFGKFLNLFVINVPRKARIDKDTVIWTAAFEIGQKNIRTHRKNIVAKSKKL
jgi:hypothetical protein